MSFLKGYFNWQFRLDLNKVMYIASSFLLLVAWLQAFAKSVLSCSYIGCCCSDDLKAQNMGRIVIFSLSSSHIML